MKYAMYNIVFLFVKNDIVINILFNYYPVLYLFFI